MAARVGNIPALAGNWGKLSIYKVPCCMRGGNKKLQLRAYTPQIVSIGPYHHGEDHLQSMEQHKQRALHHFLERSNTRREALLDPLAQVVQDLIHSYDDLDSSWKTETNKFLELMIVDGVFMLEVFRSAVIGLDYTDDDRIFGRNRNPTLLSIIKRDLLMLENQLPMAVLGGLVAVGSNNSEGEAFVINSLISPFFFPSRARSNSNLGECKHVLDVCRNVLVLEEPDRTEGRPRSFRRANDEAENNEIVYPARVLNAAGVQFEVSESRSLKGTSFRVNRIFHRLKLPRIIIDHDSETLFHNLLAFERLHSNAGNEVTSYLAFMNIIIKDKTDVRALSFPGIIIKTNNVHDQTVVELLQSLPKDITVHPESNLAMVTKDLIQFTRTPSKWNFVMARFRLDPELHKPIKLAGLVIAYMGLIVAILRNGNGEQP